jgi:hypothetical protein
VTTGVAGSGSWFVRGSKALSLLACLLLRVAVMGQHTREAYGQTFHFLYPQKNSISFSPSFSFITVVFSIAKKTKGVYKINKVYPPILRELVYI